MNYDNSHCSNYEEYCEEILAYMRCQNESFDFGEGMMSMDDGGEYGMYKFAILPYLNSFHETEFSKWWKTQQVKKLHRRIESKFDDLSNKKLNSKLNNNYDRNMKYRSMTAFNAKYNRHKFKDYPYITKFDNNGNEYVTRCNIDRKRDKAWDKKKPITRSYQHYCDYCERVIVYEEDTVCDNCYCNFEAEGLFVFKYWKEMCIMNSNDYFLDYQVSEGKWLFHDLK